MHLAGGRSAADLTRFQHLLQTFWHAFDSTVQGALGKPLRKGPRGGGRELDKIVVHTRDVDLAYLRNLGGKPGPSASDLIAATRQMILLTLEHAAHGDIPARGPRGGLRWTPRYFVRRHAWHVLDHTWEIEDRIE